MTSHENSWNVSRRAAMLTAASAAAIPLLGLCARHAFAAMPAQTQFQIFRNGSEVGYHRFDIQEAGGRKDVSIDILLEVGLGPIVLYRYIHRNREIYQDGEFVSFASETDDDGEQYSVSAERVGDVIQVSRSFGEEYETQDPTVMPTTWWNAQTTRANRLLDTQKGRLLEVAVSPLGWTTVSTPEGEIDARRFEVDGDLTLTLWYDRQDRLVKLYFPLGGADFDYSLV